MKRTEIDRLLPSVLRRAASEGTPLSALLGVMEALHEPAEEILGRLPEIMSTHGGPDSFVPVLATWVDLDWLWQVEGRSSIARPSVPGSQATQLSCGPGRLRDLVASAAYLSQWRGTARGLCAFLTLATGMPDFVIDEQVPGPDGRPLPFHIHVQAPGDGLHRALIERIIQAEKPAYVTFELSFAEAEV